jgi:hypothetical protein
MTIQARERPPVAFSPGLEPVDPLAGHWLRQVTLRLRREICWLWHQRGLTQGDRPWEPLPPAIDRLQEALDLTRFAEARGRFFVEDVTARYLTEQLAASPPPEAGEIVRGSFGWVVRQLELDGAARFVLALGLLATFDNAAGPVVAACANDPAATRPSLALAQRLWDDPAAVVSCADPSHALWRHGLLQRGSSPVPGSPAIVDWERTYAVPAAVASRLLGGPAGPLAGLAPLVAEGPGPRRETWGALAARLRRPADRLRVIPVVGPRGSPFGEVVAQVCRRAGRQAVRLAADPGLWADPAAFGAVAACCWLEDVDLFLDLDMLPHPVEGRILPAAARTVPLNLFVAVESASDLDPVPRGLRLPPLEVPTLSFEERAALWHRGLPGDGNGLDDAADECARRFRVPEGVIRSICEDLGRWGDPIEPKDLFAACRAEVQIDLCDLAEPVEPRFRADELVLPHKQAVQLDEIRQAMRSLRRVHYQWGTARAWSEAGLSVLFAGAPGTGKTMAAETLARDLDLPMYRIDLSQVVNKYVGETPKNLKRLFDAADAADLILFFDEADALFGKRSEVKDAHDRYANIEINYLLSRMERAKGLTILATNRREDLDEAFVRRLRFLVEFPQPEADQRRRIWEKAIPGGVDASGLDLDFLARRFPLTGGHIRSAVFHACLQCASVGRNGSPPRLEMPALAVAVRRELEKQNRAMALGQFGPYARHVEQLEEAGGGS